MVQILTVSGESRSGERDERNRQSRYSYTGDPSRPSSTDKTRNGTGVVAPVTVRTSFINDLFLYFSCKILCISCQVCVPHSPPR